MSKSNQLRFLMLSRNRTVRMERSVSVRDLRSGRLQTLFVSRKDAETVLCLTYFLILCQYNRAKRDSLEPDMDSNVSQIIMTRDSFKTYKDCNVQNPVNIIISCNAMVFVSLELL